MLFLMQPSKSLKFQLRFRKKGFLIEGGWFLFSLYHKFEFSADILEIKGKMVPLLFAFLALPCLGKQGATKGLSQITKEEDKFHLLTEVCLDQIYQREEYKFYSGTFCLNQTNFYFPYKAYQLFSQQNIP